MPNRLAEMREFQLRTKNTSSELLEVFFPAFCQLLVDPFTSQNVVDLLQDVRLLEGTGRHDQRRAREQASIARTGELAAQSIALQDKGFSVSLIYGVPRFMYGRNPSHDAYRCG